MDGLHKQVFFPKTLPEIFTIWKQVPGGVLFAGGTDLLKEQENKHTLEMPNNIISLDKLDELRHFTRTERYIEIGSMVKLNDILNMGKIIPPAFTEAIKNIAGPEIRNLATLGGNICNPAKCLDTSASLIALDARYELRSAQASRWISASRFSSPQDSFAMNPQELLTRVRIPLEQWDYSVYKKFVNPIYEYKSGGSMVFLVRSQKNILADIRVVYAGETVLRDKNNETLLSGKPLPLDRRDVSPFLEQWKTSLSDLESLEPFLRNRILNFLEASIGKLTD